MQDRKNGDKSHAKKRNSKKIPIVGIGASAGGLEALKRFFKNLPSDTGMAFVIIQHLAPSHESNMVELLKRYTDLPIDEAKNKMEIEADHVYIIPPKHNMTYEKGRLLLAEQLQRPGLSHNIDLFFTSLAEGRKMRSIVIVLSGTGTDGTEGAKAVKANLGMVMVQKPEGAGFNGMPRAVISKGLADFVVSVEEMPGRLIEYVDKSYDKKPLEGVEEDKVADTMNKILLFIKAKAQRDFTGYKKSTIMRRIGRRMSLNNIETPEGYLKFLREYPGEIDLLIKDFLINVTSFFRDPEAFEALKRYLKPKLEEKTLDEDIRVWIPGCSTGEEAYSICIIIQEAMEEIEKTFHVQIFGTDLDDDAIHFARSGTYSPVIINDISEERLKKYFIKTPEGNHKIKNQFRERLIFAVHNIISDPPFTNMDLIVARNMLIYFDAEVQKKLIPLLNYSLKGKGLLFLGTAETPGDFSDLFKVLDTKWKIYVSKEKKHYPPRAPGRSQKDLRLERQNAKEAKKIYQSTDPRHMLLQALQPSILVDPDYNILYIHGQVDKYVRIPEGEPNMNLLNVIHSSLHSSIEEGLYEASRKKIPIKKDIRLSAKKDELKTIKVSVTPLKSNTEDISRLIVTFHEPREIKEKKSKREKKDGEGKALREELAQTKETLRSTIEELEASNEELSLTNEEYQSSNEELQSTNEELETSKEELESVNEELNILNSEYQKSIEELNNQTSDMKNLLTGTGISIIFLDNELRLLRFTPASTKIFNFIKTDAGRPLSHITHNLKTVDLDQEARKVLSDLKPIKKDVETTEGDYFSMRIHPYRTADNSIAGVGMTFIDISEKKRIKIEIQYYQAIVEMMDRPAAALDGGLKIMFANKAFLDTFSYGSDDILEKSILDLDMFPKKDMEHFLSKTLPEKKQVSDYRMDIELEKKTTASIKFKAKALQDSEKSNLTALVIFKLEKK